MKRMSFIFLFCVFETIAANAKSAKNSLTPFQKNIQLCLKDQIQVDTLQSLEDLYLALDKAFPLRTTEIIFREVTFKKDNEMKKLKFDKGKILLYKLLEDKSLKLINNDARQKGLTEESSVNQLLVAADVRSDWVKIKEVRSSFALLEYSRQQGKITTITFKTITENSRLQCLHRDLSDICLCKP